MAEAKEETALTYWALGGRDGAWQFFTGYVSAVRMASATLSGQKPRPPPLYAPLVHGEEWARRVRGYADALVLEVLSTEEKR